MEHRVLVTGATSKVGRELIERLPRSGALVKAASRSLTYPMPRGVSPVTFDYCRPTTWDAALDSVRQLFLVVPFAEPNADAVCLPFIERAIRARVQRLVMLSGMNAQRDSDAVLARIERHVANAGLAYTILRANWMMQNFTDGPTRDTIVAANAIYAPAGDSRVSFVDARDVAAVAMRVLTSDAFDGETCTLSGPLAITYHQAAVLISQACGRPITYTATSEAMTHETLVMAAMPEAQSRFMLSLFARLRGGEFQGVTDDVLRVMGRPATSFEMFARDYSYSWL